ncbi:hypothetical protein XPA_007391 [Xanthoria parietina]
MFIVRGLIVATWMLSFKVRNISSRVTLDMVYGVTSNPSEEASIKIDYRLPVRRVYKNTTISLIQQARSVDSLFLAYKIRRQGSSWEEILSWCPDWSLLLEESVLDWL